LTILTRDKVELEPLPSEFLLPIKTSPIFYPIFNNEGRPIQYVQRVCGLREIYKKRQFIDYLRDVEDENRQILQKENRDELSKVSAFKDRGDYVVINIDLESFDSKLCSKVAPGGGGDGQNKGRDKAARRSKGKRDEKSNKNRKSTIVPSQQTPDGTMTMTLQDEQTPENIAKHFAKKPQQIMFVSIDQDSRRPSKNYSLRQPIGNPAQPNTVEINSQEEEEDEDDLNGNSLTMDSTSSSDSSDSSSKSSEDFDITDFDAYHEYVYGKALVEPPDKDNEWLELSSTDSEEEKRSIHTKAEILPAW
jgi:hypothetical protein